MADPRIGKAVLTIEIDGQQVKLGLGEIEKANADTAKKVKDGWGRELTGADFKAWSLAAVGAIAAIGAGIVALGSRGADIADVGASFEDLTGKVGSTAEAMLGELRAGTLGTISDFELMKMANGALSSGLITSADAAGVLAQGAQLLADRTGGDTAEAFGTLTSAIASGRTATLKQLGVFVDTKVAVENYARAHNKAASDLTDFERTQAVSAATVAALKGQLEASGPAAAGFGELVAGIATTFQNFVDKLSVGISQSPVLLAALREIGGALQGALGTNSQSAISTTIHLIESFAIGAAKAAGYVVEGARFASNAWDGLKWAFNEAVAVMLAALTGIANGFATTLEWAAKIPIMGEQFKQPAELARSFAGDLKNLTLAFVKNADDTLTSAAKSNAAFDGLSKGADHLVGAMTAAQSKAAEAGPAIARNLTPPPETTAAIDQHAVKFAEAYRKLSEDLVLSTMTGNARRLQELEFQKNAEILKAKETAAGNVFEYEAMVAKINALYANRAAQVGLSLDQIKAKETEFSQQIALQQTTGLEQELLRIQAQKAAQLASIEELKVTMPAKYAEMKAQIDQIYAGLTASAQNSFAAQGVAAANAGAQTIQQFEAAAARARAYYADVVANANSSAEDRKKAEEALHKTEEELEKKKQEIKKQGLDLLLSSTTATLRSLFGKNKAVAIATTIADTIASAVAAFKNAGGWPWGVVPAAASLAYGYAQVNQIRNQNPEGFATGTPGLDFANFGASTLSVLHRQEAVIPRGRGHLLAAEIAAAMPGGGRGDSGTLAELRALRADLAALPRLLARGIRDAQLLTA